MVKRYNEHFPYGKETDGNVNIQKDRAVALKYIVI
jgi:hypothetical protein